MSRKYQLKRQPHCGTLPGEIWKPCAVMVKNKLIEFPDYEVSNLARIRGLIYDDKTDNWPGKLANQRISTSGYLNTKLSLCKNKIWIRTARLVAHAFLGPCPNNKEVNHIDGIKTNNNIKNLEYVTHKENMEHAGRMGLCSNKKSNGQKTKDPVRWTKNNKIKYDLYYKKIYNMHHQGLSSRQIAKNLNLTKVVVTRLMKRMNLHREKSEAEKLKWKTQIIKKPKKHTKKSLVKVGRELAETHNELMTQIEFTKLTGVSFKVVYKNFGSWFRYKHIVGLK